MLDNLLYARLHAHLKRPIYIACLENGTDNQIVANLEQELEMNGFETDGELFIPTMATTTTRVNKQSEPQNAKQEQIFCRYCKKPRHVIKEYRKPVRKEQARQGEKQTIDRPNARTYLPFPNCQRTNHKENMCWNGPNAANRPGKYKTENTKDSTDDSHKPRTSTQNAPISIFKSPLH